MVSVTFEITGMPTGRGQLFPQHSAPTKSDGSMVQWLGETKDVGLQY